MLPEGWIEHRRDSDRELVGWIAIEGDGFRAYDILGRPVGDGVLDWIAAEEALDERGIGFLAARHRLRMANGSERPVRIREVNTSRVVVVADEWGMASAVGSGAEEFELSFPAGDELIVE
jgi:hypothetical protein